MDNNESNNMPLGKEPLTMELAESYRQKAINLSKTNSQYVGELRTLGKELAAKCGITELQAINILNGNHIKDYVHIYQHPVEPSNGKKKSEDKEYLEWLAEKESKEKDKARFEDEWKD